MKCPHCGFQFEPDEDDGKLFPNMRRALKELESKKPGMSAKITLTDRKGISKTFTEKNIKELVLVDN